MRGRRIAGGILFAAVCGVVAWSAGLSGAVTATITITALTAAFWMTEAIPIPAASLIPFVAFPLTGVLDERVAAQALGSHIILLLMASFMLSKSLERSGAHERLALYMVRLVGGSGRSLVLGFMLAAATLSMWISNSATTLVLSTMALALIAQKPDAKLAAPLLLGIAYAASLGGTGTLIGTPPNLIFAEAYAQVTGSEYSFLRWLKTGLPIVAVGIPLMGWWLTRHLRGVEAPALPDVGPWRVDETRVMMVFAVAMLLWITRSEPWGGWSSWFGIKGAGDAAVAMGAVVALFLLPNGRGGALLDWKSAGEIPWGMLLLFAGGICISNAFRASGLDQMIGTSLTGVTQWPVFLMMLGVCLAVSFLTELTSNTATANLLMPLLAAVAVGTGLAPELLMIPAAVSCSCAFMLPVGTAPNAIVYGTQRVPIGVMVREGLVLNLIIALVVASVAFLVLA